jgi:membrane fusion protein, multidrug efflux system
MEKTAKKALVIIITILIIGVLGFVTYQRVLPKLNQTKERPKRSAINVGFIKAEKTKLSEFLSGQAIVEGNPQVTIYPNSITGLFVNNTVKNGDMVLKDQIIAYIDRNVPGSDYALAPVRSPINGMVIKQYFLDRGASISATNPIAIIANVSSVKCTVNFGESDILKIKKGQNVTITSDYLKDVKIKTKVDSVTPFIDNDSYSGSMTVYLDNHDGKLTIGMSVNLDVEVAQRMAYVVPEGTVLTGIDKTYIFINLNNTAKPVDVKTGYSRNGMIEIFGSIKDGDEIITDGNFKLSDGSQIKVFDPENPASNSSTFDSKNSDNKKSRNGNKKYKAK